MIKQSDWRNLYGKGWSGIITPESFGHPAKFSRGLIRHIYQHLFDEGWLQPGDTVLDPFGGVALGALHALQRGLHWVGVELEQKFVDLGQQNIDLWNARFGPHLPNWGSAVLLQGDSRYLAEVVGEAGVLVSSPPYAKSAISSDGQRGIASNMGNHREIALKRKEGRQETPDGYSTNPANLGNMPAGDPGDGHGVDAVIGSPPWVDAGVGGTKNVVNLNRQCVSKNRPDDVGPGQEAGNLRYGEHTEGQLAAMPPGPGPGQVADGLVSSPPYAGTSIAHDGQSGIDCRNVERTKARRKVLSAQNESYGRYSANPANLGNSQNVTFWSAARLILQQCYQVLKVGAPAVWVVKSFVRKGKRVDFPGQWRQLCESCGFETVHVHRAWLIEDRGSQHDIFGNLHERKVERKSFFRRLAERKGSPRIDYEMVLCTVKR